MADTFADPRPIQLVRATPPGVGGCVPGIESRRFDNLPADVNDLSNLPYLYRV
jgi:hypothetical protein